MNISTNHTFDEQLRHTMEILYYLKDNYYYDNEENQLVILVRKIYQYGKRNTSTPTKKFNRNRNNSMYRNCNITTR